MINTTGVQYLMSGSNKSILQYQYAGATDYCRVEWSALSFIGRVCIACMQQQQQLNVNVWPNALGTVTQKTPRQ
jgi:hypothetical protein